MTLSAPQRLCLHAVALFGLLGPNGVFLYFAISRRQQFLAAMQNPITLAFLVEAFVVMGLLAVFLSWRPLGPWGWKSFLALSLIGGLGFSVPMIVTLNARRA
ncbi:MAG: hypothetical protein ABI995_14340 [Acidobacteriota bacterium]